jgi:hypothetical protein
MKGNKRDLREIEVVFVYKINWHVQVQMSTLLEHETWWFLLDCVVHWYNITDSRAYTSTNTCTQIIYNAVWLGIESK